MMNSTLNFSRSFLFVPATRTERILKAFSSGADAVIIDLEDAIAPSEKNVARTALMEALARLPATQLARILIRINAVNTQWHEDDVATAASASKQGLGGIMLAKAETAATLTAIAGRIHTECVLVPLIESVKGLDSIDLLASAPKVMRLAFGHLDFQLDAGIECDTDEAELAPVRLAFALASRRANLGQPIDGVSVDLHQQSRLLSDIRRAKRGGFGGKLCIHPSQVEIVNTMLSPDMSEIDKAKRILEAEKLSHGGVFSLDGKMVDAPILQLARRTLARASQSSITNDNIS